MEISYTAVPAGNNQASRRLVGLLSPRSNVKANTGQDKARSPVLECLEWAACTGWSGQIVVETTSHEALGSIFFQNGRLAWALSKYQKINLVDYLERLGKVRRSQFGPIRSQFLQSAGRKDLGKVLEEAGMIRRPVFRRSLLLHTRGALETLLRNDALGNMQSKNIQVSQDMTFSWEEAMLGKAMPKENKPPAESNACEPLLNLAELPGYEASAILTTDGQVLYHHAIRSDFDPALFATYLASVMEASSNAVVCADLGAIKFLLLDCIQGCLVTCWINSRRTHLAAVLVGEESQLGSVKYEMGIVIPKLARFLGEPADLKP